MRFALVACADATARETVRSVMRGTYHLDFAADKESCLQKFRSRRYDITLLDLVILCGPDVATLSVDFDTELQPFWTAFSTADIIVLAPTGAVREAVRAVRAGAMSYLTLPIEREELSYALESIRNLLITEAELDYLRDQFWNADAVDAVRSRSPLMKECVREMQLVAPTKATVLLIGETGTGKGVLARLIHQHCSRQSGPFVSVHCGAIPDALLESELFGHEKGAFTGATHRRLGKFEIANGGTIFLDEVGTLSPPAQIKLLQVLQERVLQRVGGEAQVEVDVRVIAATNVDLKGLCDNGTFRTDLFYRLNVFPITVPPLRERREDIPLLAETLLKRLNRQQTEVIRGIHPDVMAALQTYPWPGNVREMENLFERAHILEQSSMLSACSFPAEVVQTANRTPMGQRPDTTLTLDEFQHHAMDALRKQYLQAQLAAHLGRIDRTAGAAGISPRHLHKLMRQYGLRKESYKPHAAEHPAAGDPHGHQ